MKGFIAAIVVLALSGCANLGVDPWQRGTLADPRMALEADALDKGFDDHIYFSKEASSGGRGTSGGGCGCN
ncbi:DUF4266 domain-containing protein [Ferrimonas balearica]|uniref:DUF4266 domain-containing protein n=1 Tax=Ferrimonas balearica TaxID=44012 RepID=UPI001C595F42|nr:DUF4266 domain-containing protein [Ferrimonas balearica]MBW3138843.1 DUF4266 domain-containing protein [Ferrimonas balearica]MBY6105906.1 DUF4266 domain-containing protein [Ferrimonas balearica]MBY6223496.1 DUF4266 domain-containing protein [Ferrimonas balearica]